MQHIGGRGGQTVSGEGQPARRDLAVEQGEVEGCTGFCPFKCRRPGDDPVRQDRHHDGPVWRAQRIKPDFIHQRHQTQPVGFADFQFEGDVDAVGQVFGPGLRNKAFRNKGCGGCEGDMQVLPVIGAEKPGLHPEIVACVGDKQVRNGLLRRQAAAECGGDLFGRALDRLGQGGVSLVSVQERTQAIQKTGRLRGVFHPGDGGIACGLVGQRGRAGGHRNSRNKAQGCGIIQRRPRNPRFLPSVDQQALQQERLIKAVARRRAQCAICPAHRAGVDLRRNPRVDMGRDGLWRLQRQCQPERPKVELLAVDHGIKGLGRVEIVRKPARITEPVARDGLRGQRA